MIDRAIDMSIWDGRADPEANSERWHQRIQSIDQANSEGVALLGFASDAGVKRNKGRPGARKGPSAIRSALAPLAWHRQGEAFDAGDVECQGDALEDAQFNLGEQVAQLLNGGHLPIVLGGGHEIAFGSWQGLTHHLEKLAEKAPKVGIINLDTHFDLRDPGYVRSSGTPFSQIAEQCEQRGWLFQYACLGVSRANNTQALFQHAHDLNVMVYEDREIFSTKLGDVIRDIQRFMANCEYLYLTIDLDVLPAAEAPGVSAPAARGVSLAMLEPLIETIRDSGKLLLADIAELNPSYDIDNRTAKVAARLVHQLTLNG